MFTWIVIMGVPKMNSSIACVSYARVSTVDQNPDARIAALEVAGCGSVLNSVYLDWPMGVSDTVTH